MNNYSADELLNLAIMSKTPYIIVEGVNDICIYESIAESEDIECEVYCIDQIENGFGGCGGVISILEYLDGLPLPSSKKLADYILGIIDRDARTFRGEVPEIESILVLKYYSIESHFVSKASIEWAVRNFTRISVKDNIDCECIYSEIMQSMNDLYYFSLEALKGALKSDYGAKVGYSDGMMLHKSQSVQEHLNKRTIELDEFANDLGVKKNKESLFSIVKGKWLLELFSICLLSAILILKDKCKAELIKKCRVCSTGVINSCLFQASKGLNKDVLQSALKKNVSSSEFNYIRLRMHQLSESCV